MCVLAAYHCLICYKCAYRKYSGQNTLVLYTPCCYNQQILVGNWLICIFVCIFNNKLVPTIKIAMVTGKTVKLYCTYHEYAIIHISLAKIG